MLILVAFAHAPLLAAGLLARDYAALLGRELYPLARASAWLADRVLGLPRPGEGALPLRLAQVASLAGCAAGAWLLLRRLLEPRLGVPAARRAALLAALLFLVHPRTLLASAALGARAELLGLALATWAAALFLVGRQAHADALTSASLVLFLAAGFVAPSGAPLALLVAVAEFACVRRHRKRALRLRTAATTAAVFGAAALLPLLLLRSPDSGGPAPSRWAAAGETLLGLALPVAEHARWSTGALAAAVLLAALWPAFQAARHAPRLWSGMSLVWSLALLLALLGPRPGSGGLAVLAWCAGLGVTLGARLPVGLPLRAGLVALGLALLAHVAARPLVPAARAEGRRWAELAPLVGPPAAAVLVIDAEAPRDLGWLFHPRLVGQREGLAPFDPGRVRALSEAAFLDLARSEALEPLRARGLSVVAPLGAGPGPRLVARPLAAPSARAEPETLSWRALSHTPAAPLDPLAWERALVVADLAGSPRQIDRLGWDGLPGESGVLAGRVEERGGRFVAEFDLSASLAWRLAGAVRSLRVERGVREVERVELAARFPLLSLGGPPRPAGADWVLACAQPADAAGQGSYTLTLLALEGFERLELAALPDGHGALVARGAEAFRRRTSPAALAWILDYRVGPRVLQRARGLVP
ncbi:MAG TPA: hypothetical protein VF530_16940 [Planctomycetota bacterium]